MHFSAQGWLSARSSRKADFREGMEVMDKTIYWLLAGEFCQSVSLSYVKKSLKCRKILRNFFSSEGSGATDFYRPLKSITLGRL
jgi:hypothetical protein